MKFLVFYLGFYISIIVHEFGHYFSAKKFGVIATNFEVGVGPVLFKRRIGKTDFKFRILPLMGFVSHDSREMEKIGMARNLVVLFAGVLNNFILYVLALLIPFHFNLKLIFDMAFVKLIPGVISTISDINNFVGAESSIRGVYGAMNITGFKESLYYLSAINLGLCIGNLMPIPILDGGRMVLVLLRRFLALFGVRGQSFDKVSEPICWLSFIGITLLAVYNELMATGKFLLYLLYIIIGMLIGILILVIQGTDIYKRIFNK